jgi:hypothetical protein
MSRFEIAFSGQLLPGAAPDQVRANLARLFQADEQRIALLFSGRRVVIKSDLDEAAAEKYRSTLERAGALAEVRALDAEAPVAAQAQAHVQASAAVATPTRGGGKVVPRDEYMAAFADVEAPDFDIAPVGVDLQEARPEPVAPALDLSGISLAPVGSDMGEIPRDAGGPPPDTSHLKLE